MSANNGPANRQKYDQYHDAKTGKPKIDIPFMRGLVDKAEHGSRVVVKNELERNYVREYARQVGKKLDVDVK